ncbi:MAG: uracil-DNA glycosylase [Rhodospirillaceae bacterium]|jgi:uracil-DNA glycosylase|nr:uracil-DNA glycosylase [Rhodospirillaceae bacterium]
MNALSEPSADCGLCPRLAAFRQENRVAHRDFFNAPVPGFGALESRLLIVGLAPGLKGANRTGRPFTGDFAGDLLYDTLGKFGFASGTYGKSPEDGLNLIDCRVTNGVRCVPPQNKPVGAEINACRDFLKQEIDAMPNLQVIVALGGISHGTVLATLGQRKAAWPFAHGAVHRLPDNPVLTDSYHCSRYNTNTRRLTEDMFHDVFEIVRAELDG